MIDMHVHYFPPAVFRAIWRFFEQGSNGLWEIRYKVWEEGIVEELAAHGVTRFPTLVYAHKPGMADGLNEFVRESAARVPQLIPFGTIYAGDDGNEARARRLFEEQGFYGIKLHPFVSGEELDDERFFPVYEIMQDLGRIVVCHPGSGPVYENTDGAERIERILKRFPRLAVVIAHCGAVEYEEYRPLADKYEQVYFDTAMNCVHSHLFAQNCPGREFFTRFAERVLLGSDFPNIPYEYAHQIDSIRKFELGTEIEDRIFGSNALRLLERAESTMA